MTNANDKRVKASLERTRLKLKAEGLDLERRRREYLLERDEAIVALRLICERYGDNRWDDDLPLKEILEGHLADPLAERLQVLIRRLKTLEEAAVRPQGPPVATQAPQASQASPVPAGPRLLEPVRHSVITVRDQDRTTGRIGWKASCVCTWYSGLHEHRITATQDGGRHVAIMRNRQPANGVANHA
jgi:hypothetical protein